MTLAVASLPYLDRRLAHASLVSLATKDIVPAPWDNTHANVGVTVPWNATAQDVLGGLADWLILWSTAIVFGHTGGRDFARALVTPECYPDHPDVPRIISGIGCGFHLTAIHRTLLERVGIFDPIFFAYYGDTDWIRRHTLAGFGNLWHDGNVQVPVDLAVNRGDAHSIARGLVRVDLGAETARYLTKWGGHSNRERFTHPYDNPALDHTFVGPPPEDT